MRAGAVSGEGLRGALGAAAGRLQDAGAQAPRLDAELLMAHALGLTREDLVLTPERLLGEAEITGFDALVSRRAAREPVARILGSKEFWSLDFALNPATLVPRPDSETLVRAALEYLTSDDPRPLRILDLGTGCGCLLLALLSEMATASGIGVDSDPAALAAAGENAQQLGLSDRAEFRMGDWFGALEPGGRFDLIVSNPPYIETSAIAGLAPEVAAYEPRRALDGGADGLDAYRDIVAGAAGFLSPGGLILLELGAGQAAAVRDLLEGAGFEPRFLHDDLAGVPRAIGAVLDARAA